MLAFSKRVFLLSPLLVNRGLDGSGIVSMRVSYSSGAESLSLLTYLKTMCFHIFAGNGGLLNMFM